MPFEVIDSGKNDSQGRRITRDFWLINSILASFHSTVFALTGLHGSLIPIDAAITIGLAVLSLVQSYFAIYYFRLLKLQRAFCMYGKDDALAIDKLVTVLNAAGFKPTITEVQ